MAKVIGSLKMTILVKVGDGDPIEMGTVDVPLNVSLMDGNVLQIDTTDHIDFVRRSLRSVFADDTPPTPPTEDTP